MDNLLILLQNRVKHSIVFVPYENTASKKNIKPNMSCDQ